MMSREISAERLASSTASKAFAEAGLRRDSKLNKDSFKAFVMKGLDEMQ
jgi:hypothetical protein